MQGRRATQGTLYARKQRIQSAHKPQAMSGKKKCTHPVFNVDVRFLGKYASDPNGALSLFLLDSRLCIDGLPLPLPFGGGTRIGLPALRIFTGLILFVASASKTGALISLPTIRGVDMFDWLADFAEETDGWCLRFHDDGAGEADLFSLLVSLVGEFGAVTLRSLLSAPGSTLIRCRRFCPDDRPRDIDSLAPHSSIVPDGLFSFSFSFPLSSFFSCDDMLDDGEDWTSFSNAAFRL